MSAPLDYKYLDWPLSGDLFGGHDPLANAAPLLKFARLFASSMSPIWGGFLGYMEPEYDEDGKIIDKQPVAAAPIRSTVSETLQEPQDAANVNLWNGHMAEALAGEGYQHALDYPWFLEEYWNELYSSSGVTSGEDVIDPCVNKHRKDQYIKADLSRKTLVRRSYINQRLDYAGRDDTFAIIVYRFMKAEMGEYIRKYLENIHSSDYKSPQPELLLYLYEHISYLMDLKSVAALDYLWSKVPEIFYPYRNAFLKISTCKSQDILWDYVWPLGLVEEGMGNELAGFTPGTDPLSIIPDYGTEKSEWFSQSLEMEFEPGQIWWREQFKERLPDSFLNLNSLGADIRFSMADKLEEHLEDFSYVYETFNYKQVDYVKTVQGVTAIGGGPYLGYTLDVNDILDWYEAVIDSTLARGSVAEKNQKALDDERGDVDNLDFSLCELDPELVAPSSKCGFCQPNPDAIVPDWTERTSSEPFLNEKTCEYWITMLTPHSHVGSDNNISFIKADQIKPGLQKLLKFYDKDSSDETVNKLLPLAAAADYYVPTRANLKIRVLITISADVLNDVGDANASGADSDDKDGTGAPGGSPAPKSVVLKADDIRPFFRAATAKMFSYGVAYEIAVFKGESPVYPGLYFGPTTASGTIGNGLRLYRSKLIRFLRRNKCIINPLRKNLAKLEEVTLNFDDNFSLLSVVAKKMGCPPEEISNGFEEFKNMSPINDSDISLIVAQLPKVVLDITGNEAMHWQEFATVYVGIEGIEVSAVEPTSAPKTPGDCNANAVLHGIGKPVVAMGTQMFGQILNFPQLFMAQLGNQVCYTMEKKKKKDLELDSPKTQLARFKDQWARQLDAEDTVFQNLPQILEDADNLDDLFTNLIDKLGVCGMAALLNVGLDCITSGVSAETSLKSLVVSRIKNFSDKQLEGLFFQMNPGLQELIKNSVDELTSIPLPWEAGYQAGSYIGAGVSYQTKKIDKLHKEQYASAGAPIASEEKPYKEEEILEWPAGCQKNQWFQPPDESEYEYMWIDYDTLKFYSKRKEDVPQEERKYGTVDLSTFSKDHAAFECRPVKITIKIPLTETPASEEKS